MSGELCSSACSFCGRCDADDDRGPWSLVTCSVCGESFDLSADEQGRICDECLRLRRHDATHGHTVARYLRAL